MKKFNILSVSNGGRPVNNVTIRIPNDHTSVAKLCGFRLAISLEKKIKLMEIEKKECSFTEIYNLVYHTLFHYVCSRVNGNFFAKPKSAIF